ncbi:uncharacterized protein B0J16DRAFT_401062 [Fusarium flagelliforme]|uniref:uncharacterized protein n=1 Tax=Fusarium flagelliforme TaxID=2675880 RepID=UPI001E8D6102|nr:uncharacterized protein B0J16DRAFT_401062 [Fusarium flagelliforme]KAH7182851.1 hypothetical protein B0J16DRAFT_401062 [Fusarium flagelliforme]
MPGNIFSAWRAKFKNDVQTRARVDKSEDPGSDDNILTKSLDLTYERSPSQNSSSSHIARWLKPKRRKTTSTSTWVKWEALSNPKPAGIPNILQRAEALSAPRADLSDAFHHARERWSQDRSSSGQPTTGVPYSFNSDQRSSQTARDGFEQERSPELSTPIVEKDPPQLAPLPDLSQCSLERSTTLRACIEKASDDFVIDCKSQRHTSKTNMHHNLTPRPRIPISRPKALPIATVRPLERKKRIKSRPLPPQDASTYSENNVLAPFVPDLKERCYSLPRAGPHCAAGRSVTAEPDAKQDSEQESASRSTSITTLQLPQSVFEAPILSEQNVYSLTMVGVQSIPKPAVRLQLSNRFSSQGSNTTHSSIGLSLC